MWEQIEKLIQLSREPLPNEVDPLSSPERRNYYRFLYHLLKWRQPHVALEIGVESGLASVYMVRAAAEYGGQVIGIDINKPGHTDGYHLVLADSTSLKAFVRVGELVEQYGKIGVVYQDSSHHYKASKMEFAVYSQFLDKKAVWICDDITPSFHDPKVDPPGLGMVQYFEELPGEKRLYRDVLHFGNCQGIVLI